MADADNIGKTSTLDKALIGLYILFGVSLIGWVPVFGASFFMFDASGSARNPITMSIAYAIWTYPLTVIVAIIGNVLCRANKLSLAFVLTFALLPFAHVAWLIASVYLLETRCSGAFAC